MGESDRYQNTRPKTALYLGQPGNALVWLSDVEHGFSWTVLLLIQTSVAADTHSKHCFIPGCLTGSSCPATSTPWPMTLDAHSYLYVPAISACSGSSATMLWLWAFGNVLVLWRNRNLIGLYLWRTFQAPRILRTRQQPVGPQCRCGGHKAGSWEPPGGDGCCSGSVRSCRPDTGSSPISGRRLLGGNDRICRY